MKAPSLPARVAFSGKHHNALRAHLFPGDGKEAVAFALCGRARRADVELLLVREIVPVPHEQCLVRTEHRVTYPGTALEPIFQRALEAGLAIVKIHSHPTGFAAFSETDDVADTNLFASIFGWLGNQGPLASCIMLPGGFTIGRAMNEDGIGAALEQIRVAGDEFHYWGSAAEGTAVPEHGHRVAQAFGEATYLRMRSLKAGVVGCSGTGGITIEQLTRNGLGHLMPVDPDFVERKNLNRILNTTGNDADNRIKKTDVVVRAIAAMDLGTQVTPFACDLLNLEVLKELSTCDVIFGCMDSVDGRHLLNKLCSAYLIPYIDMGVRLDADGKGGIDNIWLNVHTLQPGGSSLKSRNVYNAADLEAAALYRRDPTEYARLRQRGYINGVDVDSPAVISVNMEAASAAMNEFLARLHPYRFKPNSAYAIRRICLSDPDASHIEGDGEPCQEFGRTVGVGDQKPFLGIMSLGD